MERAPPDLNQRQGRASRTSQGFPLKGLFINLQLQLPEVIYTYMYIYVYIYMYIYLYIRRRRLGGSFNQFSIFFEDFWLFRKSLEGPFGSLGITVVVLGPSLENRGGALGQPRTPWGVRGSAVRRPWDPLGEPQGSSGTPCGGPWAVLGEPWGGPGAASDALGCPWERRETSLGSLRGASGVLGNPLGCLGVPLRAHRGSEGSLWDASDGFGNLSKTIGFCCISNYRGTLG